MIFFPLISSSNINHKKPNNSGMLSRSYNNAPFAAYVIAFQIQNKFGLRCFHETMVLGNLQIGQDGVFSPLNISLFLSLIAVCF